jgi:hypothetical protein
LPVGIDCEAPPRGKTERQQAEVRVRGGLARRRRGEDSFNMVGARRRVNEKVYTNRTNSPPVSADHRRLKPS